MSSHRIATRWKSLKIRGLHALHLKPKIWEPPDIQWPGCLVQSNYRPLVLCGRWMWKQQEYAGIALLATDLLPGKLPSSFNAMTSQYVEILMQKLPSGLERLFIWPGLWVFSSPDCVCLFWPLAFCGWAPSWLCSFFFGRFATVR